jgi:glycerophosphoryl diester phosphodiesterase
MTDIFFDVSAYAYAHRGLWGGPRIPENSAAAFHAARTNGVGVELDVRLSSDGVPFVFHDRTLERMCGNNAALDSLPASELEHILLSNGYPIPKLAEVLDIMYGQPVLIELKVDLPGDTAIADAVAETLVGRGGQCAVMSFDAATVARLCLLIEERPVGLLVETLEKLGPSGVETLANKARAMGCDYVGPHHSSLAAAAAASGGLSLVTWTIRTPEELRLAYEHSAAPIFEGFSPALAKLPGTPI